MRRTLKGSDRTSFLGELNNALSELELNWINIYDENHSNEWINGSIDNWMNEQMTARINGINDLINEYSKQIS